MPRLVAAGVTLRKQIDKRWPRRDRRSDGWIGDQAHAARQSDHNPDGRGWVHALDIDADLDKQDPKAAQKLANQLIDYAGSGLPGSDRIKYVVFNDRIASGTYKNTWWEWRGSGYGHRHHIHVSFTDNAPVTGRRPFPLPILDGKADAGGHVKTRP
jgi:hypothetical protein